jgi:hypothetical protein
MQTTNTILNSPALHIIPTDHDRLFQLFRPLRQAHDIIRSARSRIYLEASDAFVLAWASVLSPECRVELLAGSNMTTAIDMLFEKAASIHEVETLRSDITRLTTFDTALNYLAALPSARHSDAMSLEEAANIHVAFITVSGFRWLNIYRSEALATDWLAFWRHQVERHVAQQAEQTIASLAPDEYRPNREASFSLAVDAYLTRFAWTAGLSMAISAVFPFSEYASHQLLSAVSELADLFEPLFRLALDTWFDPADDLNLAIFVVASNQSDNIRAARQRITANRDSIRWLENQLKAEEKAYLLKTRNAVEHQLARYNNTAISALLVTFCEVLFTTAHKLSAACEAMHRVTQIEA